METAQAVAHVLDETISALTLLELDRLEDLEERIAALAKFHLVTEKGNLSLILAKKRTLELLLHHSESNLNAINRVYERNVRDQWAHSPR